VIILAISTFLESSQVLFLIDGLVVLATSPSKFIIVEDVVVNGRSRLAHQIIVVVLNDLGRLLIYHLDHCLHLVKRAVRFLIRVFFCFLLVESDLLKATLSLELRSLLLGQQCLERDVVVSELLDDLNDTRLL